MADRPTSSRKKPFVERRVTQGPSDDAAVTLRRVKGALDRPLGLERKDGQLRVVFVERRHTLPADQPPMLSRIRNDLRCRLADLADTPAERLMRHLAFVGAEFARRGWSGVETLPASVLGRAVMQAEMLCSESPSEPLTLFVERVRLLKVAAEVREERMAADRRELDDATAIVSEATQEDFEASQRSWSDSLAADLAADPTQGGNRKA